MFKPEAVLTMLKQHGERLRKQKIKNLFAHDPLRFNKYAIAAEGLLLDTSKNLIDDAALAALRQLAIPLQAWQAQLKTTAINLTEHRAALHIALRHPSQNGYAVASSDVMPAVHAVLAKMGRFTEQVRSGEWTGYTGLPITDIVNIGIGGSDLGPRMAVEALSPFKHSRLQCHFVSNVDASELTQVLSRVNPVQTLFVVASKTFTTRETMLNAQTARTWFVEQTNNSEAIRQHFVAVSTNAKAIAAFGIDTANMFPFWDWVGGRYSIWSAIGLSLMLAIGPMHFADFLAGAHAMDTHFFNVPIAENLPIQLALIGFWNRAILNYSSLCIAPYHQGLARLPSYLQQLEMESNGKQVQRNGLPTATPTCPIIWGEPGTNGQHAFFQLLHQGSDIIPVDFIAVVNPEHSHHEHQQALLANCLAQAEGLMNGRDFDTVLAECQAMKGDSASPEDVWQLARHRHFPGSRPSNTLVLPRLDPAHLGKLLALYEHKVFVQGMLWNINSFDQWGVELGKVLAKELEQELATQTVGAHDGSTIGLLTHILKVRH